MAVMCIFEEEWVLVEDEGPLDISAVLASEHLVRVSRPQRSASNASKFYSLNSHNNPYTVHQKKKGRPRVKHDAQLKRELEAVQKTEKVSDLRSVNSI
jgi:hypothetical protein